MVVESHARKLPMASSTLTIIVEGKKGIGWQPKANLIYCVLCMVKYGKYQVILCKFQFSWGNNKKV
jgi:hypothetical protein